MDISKRDSIFMGSFNEKPKETSNSPGFFENLKRKFQIETVEQPVKESEKIDYNTSNINKNDPNKPLGKVEINPDNINKPVNELETITKGLIDRTGDIINDPRTKKYQKEVDERKKIYNMTLNTSSNSFNKLAEESSPYYKLYKNSDYLPLTDNDKADLMAEYDTQREIFGEDVALKDFNNKIQNIADIN